MYVVSRMIACEAALRLVSASVDYAHEQQWRIAVAVVDGNGVVVSTLRMDGAAPPIHDFALDKAYTAATMRRSTEAFCQRMESSPSLRLGLGNRPRLMVWGGGLPIVHEGQVIGGIGVSGASDAEDIACATHALRVVGLGWEP